MKEYIENIILRICAGTTGNTIYRRPLVTCARADDPLFAELKKAVGPEHLLPQDLLPEASSVVAFFLPFTRELVAINRKNPYVAREWAEAYYETNLLIRHICEELTAGLADRGVKAAWQQPTHNFDQEKLISFWSHKHVAYICGAGTFGMHQMLITPFGCAGRLGSLVLDQPLAPSPRHGGQHCLNLKEGKCLACVKSCPSGALTPKGLDKQKCYSYLLEVDAYYSDLGTCDACGKCATGGPCAILEPGD
ncbi:MAG TPA: epoxyqueuosine reductase [Bacillota bacterium]|nr:epoxyqueuosine reductase [Peptococcaceae bacterium MAG4]NLW37724.1 epoxyqueuosine reductase [Peptococcaceae bacterium]HPZ43211.1 epoxyqueuosine reductase [Bacillota bacterium]HQD76043.1 epoxyqueuosine reductase [Bacillota bacterium]HUM58441.1 epoxyqueuosine reductase [Bacillota bacterium]